MAGGGGGKDGGSDSEQGSDASPGIPHLTHPMKRKPASRMLITDLWGPFHSLTRIRPSWNAEFRHPDTIYTINSVPPEVQ